MMNRPIRIFGGPRKKASRLPRWETLICTNGCRTFEEVTWFGFSVTDKLHLSKCVCSLIQRRLQKIHWGYDKRVSKDVLGRSYESTFPSAYFHLHTEGSRSHTVTIMLIIISLSVFSFWIWGFHSGDYEEFYLQDVMPCSAVKVNGRFVGKYCFHLRVRRVNQA
jgi:hypothetical protein